MERTRWAVLGPGVISGFFARALPRSEHGLLHAVGSSDPTRAQVFAREHGAPVAGGYAEVLARDDVDAVYIGTVHTTHAELCTAALEAGKAVLCEKPVTTTAADTRAVLAVADRASVPFLEAYKYRFGPLADELRRIVRDGAIGRPVHVEAASRRCVADPDREVVRPGPGRRRHSRRRRLSGIPGRRCSPPGPAS